MNQTDEARIYKVLLVDDSDSYRCALAKCLAREKDIQIVGEAADGRAAVELAIKLRPDVVVMDVMMPKMNGIEALRLLSASCPTPVLLTSVIARHPEERERLKTLFAGRQEVLDKPALVGPSAVADLSSLLRRIRTISGTARQNPADKWAKSAPSAAVLVAIAASTGGMPALAEVLRPLPVVFPPLCIAQHLDAEFLDSFVRFLHQEVQRPVQVVEKSIPLEPGRLYVPQPRHHLTIRPGGIGVLRALPTELSPSADVLFGSLAGAGEKDCVGVVLTGMGQDGALGLRRLHDAGGWTISQDPKSALVGGMPSAAVELGGCSEVLSLQKIAMRLASLAPKPWSKR